jgi:hypothetical protein
MCAMGYVPCTVGGNCQSVICDVVVVCYCLVIALACFLLRSASASAVERRGNVACRMPFT